MCAPPGEGGFKRNEMVIDGMKASRAANMVLAFEFQYYIQKQSCGKFARFAVHVNRTFASVWLLRDVFLRDVITTSITRSRDHNM